jgi:hypothetical protein
MNPTIKYGLELFIQWLILIVILFLFCFIGHSIFCSDHKDADTINPRLSDSEMFK